VLLIVPALVVLVYTARQALDATAQLQATLMDPEKALPLHAVAWIKHQLRTPGRARIFPNRCARARKESHRFWHRDWRGW